MKIIIFSVVLCFCSKGFSQTDEHVLLNLGLDSVFNAISDKDPGGSFFIQQENQILYSRSYGLVNLKTKEKFSESTVSNISEITKTFIAYSIFILQDQKKLVIDDSIVKFFPEIKKDVGKIKIKHLLTHTSGLPDIVTNNNENIDFLNEIDKPAFDPGSNFKYSEISYKILALIIQKVSNISWQEYIKKNIFAPAGMINAKISASPTEVLSYKRSGKKYRKFKIKKKIKNKQLDNACISVGELRKYAYAVNECVFLNCDSLESTAKPWMPNNWRSLIPLPHSYVWFMKETKNKSKLLYYEGIQNGFRTYIALCPKEKIIIILLNNNNVSYSNAVMKRLNELGYIK